jgi:ATP-dependent DNA helicase RecQ
MEVLNYIPQTDKPQVTFLSPRQDIKNVIIDKAYIEQRKAVFKQKMEAVFYYAEAPNCRSRMLLSYFDEHNAHKCGVCDICLEEKRRQNLFDATDRITDEIARALSTAPQTLDDLMQMVTSGIEKERIAVIRLLLDAGKIKTDGERYYL